MFFSALSVVFGLIALLVLLYGAKLLVRSGWLLGWLRGMGGVALLAIAVFFFLVALDIRQYQQFMKDQPIAKVSFKRISAQKFHAVFIEESSLSTSEFQLNGDQWQVDARILRWKGLLHTLGGKPGYQLDRISGRYISIEEERSKTRTVHKLMPNSEGVVDVWRWLHLLKDAVPGVDAVYGSATFVPMADGALYQLSVSNSGMVATPLNDAAKNAVYSW